MYRTIQFTGSARYPIDADVVHWNLAVSADVPDSAISEPPVQINQISLLVAPKHHVPGFRLIQRVHIDSRDIDRVENVVASTSDLLSSGVPVSTGSIVYLATDLADARVRALTKAIGDAHRRAETIVSGIGGHLGSVRSAQVGVFQVVPRNSTAVSD